MGYEKARDCLDDPGHSQCKDGEGEINFLRVGESRILEVESACIGVLEQALNRPAFAIGIERLDAISVLSLD